MQHVKNAGIPGFVLFAHGSRVETANQSVRDVAERMASTAGFPVEAAFLECGQPDLTGAVGRLLDRSVSRIIVVPYFLTLGTHLQRDLPVLLQAARHRYPELHIETTRPLEGHPALLTALIDRAHAALAELQP